MGAISPMMNLFNFGMAVYRAKVIVHVPEPGGGTFRARLADLHKVGLGTDGDELVLRVPAARVRPALPGAPGIPWFRWDPGETRELRGDDAIRAAGAILPRINSSGGSQRDVQRAVNLLEDTPSLEQLFRRTARAHEEGTGARWMDKGRRDLLRSMPASSRLALEMAAHEDSERRALEGELHILEAAWRNAEEIARIADDMFLPASVDEELARLKRQRDDDRGAGGEP
jgi:hypothetical protein